MVSAGADESRTQTSGSRTCKHNTNVVTKRHDLCGARWDASEAVHIADLSLHVAHVANMIVMKATFTTSDI